MMFKANKILERIQKDSRETVGEAVGETVERILNVIKNNPKITKQGLSKETGLSVRGIEWNLKKLKETGLLKRIGPTKGGYWQIIKK